MLGAATVGTVALLIWRRHQREQPLGRLRRMRRALARMIDDPDAVARSPGPGQQVVAAAAKPVVGGIVRRLIG